MKKIRIFALVAALLMIMTAFTGCFAPQEKKFSKAGMTITLDSSFHEKDIVSQTAMYMSNDILVTVVKEEFSLFENLDIDPEEYSLTDYAELIVANNKFEDVNIETKDGLTGFVFENDANGKTYKYSAYVFKGSDAFWLFQIAVIAKDYDKHTEQIKTIAKSIVVE
jgi:hypothetical protein